MPLNTARFHEQFQMARNAGLRLAENGHEFTDGELRLGEQGQQAQPGYLGRRLKAGKNDGKRRLRWEFHGSPS